jgi:hypothetical protein
LATRANAHGARARGNDGRFIRLPDSPSGDESDGARARDRSIDDAESLAPTPTAGLRNFERARVANTEIYELKIHTRVDQVNILWGVDGAGRTVAHDVGTVYL